MALPASFAEHAALALQMAQAQADRGRLAVFEDRDRIGRDLHDLVIQRLFAVGLTLDSAARLTDPHGVATRITGAIYDIDATIKDIRQTIFELSAPAASSDLRAELSDAVATVVPALGFTPRLRMDGPVDSPCAEAAFAPAGGASGGVDERGAPRPDDIRGREIGSGRRSRAHHHR